MDDERCSERMYKSAKLIYVRFIKEGCEDEINISSANRKYYLTLFEELYEESILPRLTSFSKNTQRSMHTYNFSKTHSQTTAHHNHTYTYPQTNNKLTHKHQQQGGGSIGGGAGGGHSTQTTNTNTNTNTDNTNKTVIIAGDSVDKNNNNNSNLENKMTKKKSWHGNTNAFSVGSPSFASMGDIRESGDEVGGRSVGIGGGGGGDPGGGGGDDGSSRDVPGPTQPPSVDMVDSIGIRGGMGVGGISVGNISYSRTVSPKSIQQTQINHISQITPHFVPMPSQQQQMITEMQLTTHNNNNEKNNNNNKDNKDNKDNNKDNKNKDKNNKNSGRKQVSFSLHLGQQKSDDTILTHGSRHNTLRNIDSSKELSPKEGQLSSFVCVMSIEIVYCFVSCDILFVQFVACVYVMCVCVYVCVCVFFYKL